jgi:hypothetical protein
MWDFVPPPSPYLCTVQWKGHGSGEPWPTKGKAFRKSPGNKNGPVYLLSEANGQTTDSTNGPVITMGRPRCLRMAVDPPGVPLNTDLGPRVSRSNLNAERQRGDDLTAHDSFFG